MEVVVWFVFIGGFALCAGLVYVISVFGVQGETFEEAVEKQRNQNKEKKKEKKPPAEKKKKQKKGKEGKEAKNAQDAEEENLLVDPHGDVVEPVFVEPVKEPAPVVKKKAAVEAVQKAAVEVIKEQIIVETTAPVQQAPPKPEKKKIEIVEVAEVKVEEKVEVEEVVSREFLRVLGETAQHRLGRQLTKDEKLANENGIPPEDVNRIISMPMDEFNDYCTQNVLSDDKINILRDIRRRGKNKVEAQNCRKRKMDQVENLQKELDIKKKKGDMMNIKLKNKKEEKRKLENEMSVILREMENSDRVLPLYLQAATVREFPSSHSDLQFVVYINYYILL